MSAVASRPSTPGRASAVSSRSSRSVRLAMAVLLRPAARAPRAGWSQAMIISRPPGSSGGHFWRVTSSRAIRPGSVVRTSFSSPIEATNSPVGVDRVAVIENRLR